MVAEKNNAICSVCGKSYHKCLSCRDSMKLQPYKMHCCSSDCYKVFQSVRGYNTGVYNKDEFKSKLNNIDLRDLENYKDNIKTLINSVLKEDKPVVETIKQADTVVEAVEIIEETITEDIKAECSAVEEIEIAAPRKRNYKAKIKIEEIEEAE